MTQATARKGRRSRAAAFVSFRSSGATCPHESLVATAQARSASGDTNATFRLSSTTLVNSPDAQPWVGYDGISRRQMRSRRVAEGCDRPTPLAATTPPLLLVDQGKAARLPLSAPKSGATGDPARVCRLVSTGAREASTETLHTTNATADRR